jgi:F-box protein 18 (helicase)
MKITAFAGTGKSTTLIRYAQTRPNLRFLYVAYDKQIVAEAKTQFPSNVTLATTHALAREAVGISYHNSPEKNGKEKIQYELSLYHVLVGLPQKHLQAIKKTIKSYFASADLNLCLRHAPLESSVRTCQYQPVVTVEDIPLDRR